MTTATMERKPATTTKGPDLAKTTVLVKLESHSFGNSRKLKESQYEVEGADKTMTSANRRLLSSPELDEINRVIGEAWNYVRGQALPFPIKTIYMIPQTKVEDIAFQLKLYDEKIGKAVDRFVEVYVDRIAEAKQRNPKVFNPLDYVPADKVRREFDFSYQFVSIGVPEQQLNIVNPEILAKARKDSERLWADAADLTRQMQAEIMQTLVGKLREKLEDDGSGKPKRFQSSTVENLTDFLRQFEKSMNVTDYKELETLVKQARTALNGNSADDLKDSVTLRAKVRTELKAIESKLVPIVGERKFRKSEE